MMNNRGNSNGKEGGHALVWVLIILLVGSILGMAIMQFSASNYKRSAYDNGFQNTYFIADSGLQYAIDRLEKALKGYRPTSSNGLYAYVEDQFKTPLVLSDFQKVKGVTPRAEIVLINDKLESGYKDYYLVSTGKIGSHVRKVRQAIRIKAPAQKALDRLDYFLFTPKLQFKGSAITNHSGIVYVHGIDTHNLNGETAMNVANVFFAGPVNLDGGSAGFGSALLPNDLFFNDDVTMWQGFRNVYGDMYINGDFKVKDAILHGVVYVNGNLTLGYSPDIKERIEYTGELVFPSGILPSVLAKCVKVAAVPTFELPQITVSLKEDAWYAKNGYLVGGKQVQDVIPNSAKYYVDDFTSHESQNPSGATIIISKGNIKISGDRMITGVLIAPNGSVTLGVSGFTGTIVAGKGVIWERGGSAFEGMILDGFFKEKDLPIRVFEGSDGLSAIENPGEVLKLGLKNEID